jgi:hypothetical protein
LPGDFLRSWRNQPATTSPEMKPFERASEGCTFHGERDGPKGAL